jgi:CheY-like chemotaxis protein
VERSIAAALEIKRDERLRTVPLIFTTSLDEASTFEIFREIGFAPYVRRPISHEQLVNAVGVLIDGKGGDRPGSRPAVQTNIAKNVSKQRPILVVEDHVINQLLLRKVIEGAGFRMDVVSNGKEALAALDDSSYSMVITDCHMPEMDGFELARCIRQKDGVAGQVPIVAVTADASVEAREKCLSSGMTDFLSKPYQKRDLIQLLNRYLGSEQNGLLV